MTTSNRPSGRPQHKGMKIKGPDDSLEKGLRAGLFGAIRDRKTTVDHVESLLSDLAAIGKLDSKTLANGLCLSSAIDRVDFAKVLLQKGASVNAQRGDNRTALSLAISPDMIGLLFDHGANANVKDDKGRTALMFTFIEGKDHALIPQDLGQSDAVPAGVELAQKREAVVLALIKGGASLHEKDGIDESTALMYASKRPNCSSSARLLVQEGAHLEDVDAEGRTSLHVAALHDCMSSITTLLDLGAGVDARDKEHRTVLHYLAADEERAKKWHGADNHLHAPLLPFEEARKTELGQDSDGAQKDVQSILKLLHKSGANFMARDVHERTPLHSAAVSGNLFIVKLLVEDYNVEVNAIERRMKTPLHWAAKKSNVGVVKYLLTKGALPNAEADGGWTALHTACEAVVKPSQDGYFVRAGETNPPNGTATSGRPPKEPHKGGRIRRTRSAMKLYSLAKRETVAQQAAAHCPEIATVEALLDGGSDLNHTTHSGQTPLHIASEAASIAMINGILPRADNAKTVSDAFPNAACTAMIRYLLSRRDVERNARDAFGNTALAAAAQLRLRPIVQLFDPKHHASRLSSDARQAAECFKATVVDFGNFKQKKGVTPPKLVDLEGGGSWKGPSVKKLDVFDLLYGDHPVLPDMETSEATPVEDAGFRWIHLPANNIAWCHELLTKWFVERKDADRKDGDREDADYEVFRALERSFNHQYSGLQAHSQFMLPAFETVSMSAAPAEHHEDSDTPNHPGPGVAPLRKQSVSTILTNKSAATTKSTMSTATNTSSSSNSKPERLAPVSRPKGLTSFYSFMPYLHFETDSQRREMQAVVKEAWNSPSWSATAEASRPERQKQLQHGKTSKTLPTREPIPDCPLNRDVHLVRAHLNPAKPNLHIRRTLDQSSFRNIDTDRRDKDQVIWRYQKRASQERISRHNAQDHGQTNQLDEDGPKILMVDQLWMWIVTKQLIITSFPERWHQPRNDRYNVLNSIIATVNAPTRPRIRNVFELASVIASSCSTSFTRFGQGGAHMPFLDMFEASIGDAAEQESRLFDQFEKASAMASHKFRHPLDARREGDDPSTPASGDIPWEQHFNTLLDVGPATNLLREVKDIHDELTMIEAILGDQRKLLPVMKKAMLAACADSEPGAGAQWSTVRAVFEEQQGTIDHALKEIRRMKEQTRRIDASVTTLLDLKQKHATARQAADTALQGRTLMIFTIVTVLFLPLSFIAAFFAIPVTEFVKNNNQQMALSYVSRFVFGVGLSIALFCVLMAVFFRKVGLFIRWVSRRLYFWIAGKRAIGSLAARVPAQTGQASQVTRSWLNLRIWRFDAEKDVEKGKLDD